MTDSQIHPRVYLLRHGDAKPKHEDPERGLTDAGRTDVTKMAAWAVAAGIQVGEIRHSGKLRAQQTAEIFAEHLGTPAMAASGLAPNDAVASLVGTLEHEQFGIMLVGHLPFLERLAAVLITGNAEEQVLTLEAGALVELTRTDDGWKATFLMQPRLLL